jgi:hypothetical protein
MTSLFSRVKTPLKTRTTLRFDWSLILNTMIPA